jgi:hypothetical protein
MIGKTIQHQTSMMTGMTNTSRAEGTIMFTTTSSHINRGKIPTIGTFLRTLVASSDFGSEEKLSEIPSESESHRNSDRKSPENHDSDEKCSE